MATDLPISVPLADCHPLASAALRPPGRLGHRPAHRRPHATAELVEGDVTSARAAIAGRYLGERDGARFAAERRSRPGVLLRLIPTAHASGICPGSCRPDPPPGILTHHQASSSCRPCHLRAIPSTTPPVRHGHPRTLRPLTSCPQLQVHGSTNGKDGVAGSIPAGAPHQTSRTGRSGGGMAADPRLVGQLGDPSGSTYTWGPRRDQPPRR